MLLSVVAWEDGIRSACESKVRCELHVSGRATLDAPGKVMILPATMDGRAVESVRWTLERNDAREPSEAFSFTTLMPAYTLADAAETCDPEKPGSGDPRLIMLQSLWDQLKPIDVAIVVRRRLGDGQLTDDTLVDAARDLSRKIIAVDPGDVWDCRFGKRVAAELIKLAGKRRGGTGGHAGHRRKNVRGNAGRSR